MCLSLLLMTLAQMPELAASQARQGNVIQAELAFSDYAQDKGMDGAFLAFFAEDGLILRPGPVNVHESLKAKPRSGSMVWQPSHALVAASGELALSTGPWAYTSPSGEQRFYGQFVSIWQKNEAGIWEVKFDAGNSHDAMPRKDWPAPPSNPVVAGSAVTQNDGALKSLEEKDDQLSQTCMKQGEQMAMQAVLAEDARGILPALVPQIGAKQVATHLVDHGLEYRRERLHMAQSGDFAYCFGLAKKPQADAFSKVYLRVWRRHPVNGWQLHLLLDAPMS